MLQGLRKAMTSRSMSPDQGVRAIRSWVQLTSSEAYAAVTDLPLACCTVDTNSCSLVLVLLPLLSALLSSETRIEASALVIQPREAPSLTALIRPLIVA